MAEGFEAVALARALVHDPGLINAMAEGRITQSGCTACNRCVTMMYSPGGTSCVLQPANDATLNRLPVEGQA